VPPRGRGRGRLLMPVRVEAVVYTARQADHHQSGGRERRVQTKRASAGLPYRIVVRIQKPAVDLGLLPRLVQGGNEPTVDHFWICG
jgi:hypothetical protein